MGGLKCATGCERARACDPRRVRGVWREGEPPPHTAPPTHTRNRMRSGDPVERAFVGKAGGQAGKRAGVGGGEGSAHAQTTQLREVGVRREKGRGGRSCCAGSSRRGRGCGVPGAEDGRHWSPREGRDPAPDGTGRERVGPARCGLPTPPPHPDLNKAQALRSRAPLDPRSR